MNRYIVSAQIETVTRPTSVRSAGGRGIADPGQVVVTFPDDTQVVFATPEIAAFVFGTPVADPPAQPKAAKKK